MFGWLIAIRNFFLALTLSWLGISLVHAKPVKPDQPAVAPVSLGTAISCADKTKRHH